MRSSDVSSVEVGPKRKRVVMLLSNPATFDQRPLKEAHVLAKAGRSVTILAWDRELETRSDSVFDDGLVVRRLRIYAGHGTPIFTVPKILLFYLWCLAHLLGSRMDAVHCHDVDTLAVGLAAKVLKLRRPKLVYDMHDLPEAFLRFFPMTRITQSIFLASAKKLADAIVVVNDKFVTYLAGLGFDERKLVVVMNAPPAESARRTKRRGKTFNVLYYGWLGEERGVRLLVEAVESLPGVTLSFAGRGELEGWVREAAARNSSVKFLGWLKMKDLEPIIANADLIPSLYEPRTKNAEMATPGKLLTAMSLSLPSLVPAGSYQAEIVDKFHCGIVVNWKEVADVRWAIERLATDESLYAQLAAASYQAFVSAFSWEVMGSRLAEAYDRMLSGLSSPR